MYRKELTKVWAFTMKNWLNSRRNVFTIFEIIFWPTVGVVSVGLMTRFLELSAEMTAYVLIGTMALSIIQVTQLDVAYALLFEMWGKSVKHQFLAPVAPWHVVLGSWLMGVVRGMAVFVLLVSLTWWGFDFDFFQPGFASLAAFLLGLFLTAALVGLLVMILLLTFGLRAEVSAWSSVSLILLLAGIYYPVSMLPPPLPALAAWIPLSYFLDGFRAGYGFEPTFRAPFLKGFTISFLYLALAYWGLTAAVGLARRTGTLLRLSE